MPAASSARPLNPAAASTDGPEPADSARSARSAATAGREGAGVTAGGCRGPTSVPTGLTFPSTVKPQFSRLSPALISVSAGQCSRLTISVTPCRLAIPTEVAPAALVQPILPPNAPAY